MREIVKIRSVAGSLVVSLPQSVLEPVGLGEGDRVVVEAAPPRRLVITKEGRTMTSTQHLEMEIDLLEKKKTAIESDIRYKARQYNGNMPCEPGLEDESTAFLILMELERDRDRLDVEIAEKRLEVYDVQGGGVTNASGSAAVSEVPPLQLEVETGPLAATGLSKLERAWFHLPGKRGQGQFLALANAKGSCSLRRFDAETGTAFPKGANGTGDYRTVFYKELRGAIPLTVSRQPNLARDCKSSLPPHILRELQKQIESVPAEA
jgi:antitoxin component of MazEF toxin-antitoxin module